MTHSPPMATLQRFCADLAGLGVESNDRLGLAVSGGPDSLALLQLASAAMDPDRIAVASVDHRLRPDARAECAAVASLCATLGIDHRTLVAGWGRPPSTNIQAEARTERYRLLGQWADAHRLRWVAVAQHLDDQAETLLIRLARGSGLSGLAAIRPKRPLTDHAMLIRPLLGWRKAELAALVETVGWTAAADPSNDDPRYDRVRMRSWLASTPWADPPRLAQTARHLAEAEEALNWLAGPVLAERLRLAGDGATIIAADLPTELQRRLLRSAFERLGVKVPRGPELDRAHDILLAGGMATLSGLKLSSIGDHWQLSPVPPPRNRA